MRIKEVMFLEIGVDEMRQWIWVKQLVVRHDEITTGRVKRFLQKFVEEFAENTTTVDASLVQSCVRGKRVGDRERKMKTGRSIQQRKLTAV